MAKLQRIRIAFTLNLFSFDFARRDNKSSIWAIGKYHKVQNPRFYRGEKVVNSVKSNGGPNLRESLGGCGENNVQMSRTAVKEAQVALAEYLHLTRSLQFTDAEYISRNSPIFLKKMMERVKNEEDIGWAVGRFLRYHPINEFEPFFESMGLKHSEYSHLLPCKLMFLSDDVLMLENYHVLCNYGVDRNWVGKIYKEANEIFKYDYGVLESKLQAFEEMGLSQSSIIKVISTCPRLLIGDNRKELHVVLETLKRIGIEFELIERHLVMGHSYNWSYIFELLYLLSNKGCGDEQLQELISKRPFLLLEASKTISSSIIGLLLKFGSQNDEICSVFLEFPDLPVGKFLWNFRDCCRFLVDIGMETQDIGKIVRSHPLLLGSCSLKKINTLLANLNSGKKRVCDLINKNPQILKDWVRGSKIKRLPNSGNILRSQAMRIKFLLNLGFVENSIEMKKALSVFRGNGEELQERFDYLVKAGLDREDVVKMIKVAPQILNHKKDAIQTKIDFLVNHLGLPVSTLASFPSYISYRRLRVKLRFLMYNWLKDRGQADPCLCLSTIISCTDKVFMRRYVKRHPQGPEVFEKMRSETYNNPELLNADGGQNRT